MTTATRPEKVWTGPRRPRPAYLPPGVLTDYQEQNLARLDEELAQHLQTLDHKVALLLRPCLLEQPGDPTDPTPEGDARLGDLPGATYLWRALQRRRDPRAPKLQMAASHEYYARCLAAVHRMDEAHLHLQQAVAVMRAALT